MKSATEQAYRQRILRVLVHIQTHLDEALHLEELARVAHFSPYHFHRVFSGMVGESVMEHIRRLRLERAANRLKSSDQAVTRLAFEAGYETHESFTRAFSSMFGVSPSQYRSTQRSLAFGNVPSGVHYRPDGKLTDFQPFHSGGQPMDVRIETVSPRRVAFMRHFGPYRQVGETWEKLMAWAGPKELVGPQTMVVGVAHDDPDVTPTDKIRYDACITVDDTFKPEGGVGVQQVGGGDYAITTHRGPYETVSQTIARLCGEWLPASGREARSAPSFAVHRNSPYDTAPENLLTDIYLPLE
ncbi:MAG TPA: AraC family transcriptional regulator [Isosphaeraceae bacterium]|jgi:AraC family transcriptional regulator|nr:AraC family transcriptional regulator [Isosphaeraceae bacterium]